MTEKEDAPLIDKFKKHRFIMYDIDAVLLTFAITFTADFTKLKETWALILLFLPVYVFYLFEYFVWKEEHGEKWIIYRMRGQGFRRIFKKPLLWITWPICILLYFLG